MLIRQGALGAVDTNRQGTVIAASGAYHDHNCSLGRCVVHSGDRPRVFDPRTAPFRPCANLVVLRRSEGLPRGTNRGGEARCAPTSIASSPPHRLRHTLSPAAAVACQQGRVAPRARQAGIPLHTNGSERDRCHDLLCSNSFSVISGAFRCRQIVTRRYEAVERRAVVEATFGAAVGLPGFGGQEHAQSRNPRQCVTIRQSGKLAGSGLMFNDEACELTASLALVIKPDAGDTTTTALWGAIWTRLISRHSPPLRVRPSAG
jgi:hypothetical protein